MRFSQTALPILALCTSLAAAQVTLEEVQQHSTPDDCWSALYGEVYGLTAYGPSHTSGGGPDQVWRLCGIDGTSLFDSVHGDNQNWLQEISSIQQIGTLAAPTTSPPATLPTPEPTTLEPATPKPTTLKPATSEPSTEQSREQERNQTMGQTTSPMPVPSTSTPEPTETSTSAPSATSASAPTEILISRDELRMHNTEADCWVAYFNVVYNLTQYAYLHPDPPGAVVIHMSCGDDGTRDFASVHSQDLLSLVANDIVGNLNATSAALKHAAIASAVLGFLCLGLVGV